MTHEKAAEKASVTEEASAEKASANEKTVADQAHDAGEKDPGAKRGLRAGPGLALLGLAVPVGLFLWAHASRPAESWSDENIHAYVASRMAAGERLYAEVESARPPLALVPVAALIAAGLKPLVAARVTVVLFELGSALVLLLVARRLWGWPAGMAAVWVYLLAPAVCGSGPFTGIEVVTFFSGLAVALALREKWVAAGLACAAALGSGQHAAVIVLAVIGLALASRRASGLRVAASAALACALLIAVSLVLGGPGMWRQVFGVHTYHLGSGGGGSGGADEAGHFEFFIRAWILDDLPLLLLGALGLALALLAGREKSQARPAAIAAGIGFLHVGVVLGLRGGQSLYFHPALPLLALAGNRGHG